MQTDIKGLYESILKMAAMRGMTLNELQSLLKAVEEKSIYYSRLQER